MKKRFYVVCFTVMGGLMGLLFASLIQFFLIKNIFYFYPLLYVFSSFGLVLGFKNSFKWWQILYVEERYGKPWW